MIATAAMLAGVATPPERVLACEVFDAIEKSVHTYGGVWISPALAIVRILSYETGEGVEEEPRLEPRAFFGHVLSFANYLYETEPDLAQAWLVCALAACDRLNLTPQLIAEAIVMYNRQARRPVEAPLSWLECCAALGLRRDA